MDVNRMKKLILTLSLILGLSACAATHTPVIQTIELKDMDYSNIDNIKEGESCSLSLLGLIGPFGDVKLTDAVKNGHITKITNYDFNAKNYVLIQRYCVRAYGY